MFFLETIWSTLTIWGTAVMNILFCCIPNSDGGEELNLLSEDFISKYQWQGHFHSQSIDINRIRTPQAKMNKFAIDSCYSNGNLVIPLRNEIDKLTKKVCCEENAACMAFCE